MATDSSLPVLDFRDAASFSRNAVPWLRAPLVVLAASLPLASACGPERSRAPTPVVVVPVASSSVASSPGSASADVDVASAPPPPSMEIADAGPPEPLASAPVAATPPPPHEPEAPPVSCKTADDCWWDDHGKPARRPNKFRGKKVKPCSEYGDYVPTCAQGRCKLIGFGC